MAYYIHQDPRNFPLSCWRIDDAGAHVLNQAGKGRRIDPKAGENIWETIRNESPFNSDSRIVDGFVKIDLDQGQFYPRMARPTADHPAESPGISPGRRADTVYIANAVGQLMALTQSLERICQTVHPEFCNLPAFGHDIRNLIIIACTEVESHWRGILTANRYRPSNRNGQFRTNDYFKLKESMKLEQYTIAFPAYPWLQHFSPFMGWDQQNPTKSLPWYADYNKIKHNRENEFKHSTLLNAFSAVSACYIMMTSQYGMPNYWSNDRLKSYFNVIATPHWPLSSFYIRPEEALGGQWKSVEYRF